MARIKVTSIGNSVGIVLPKEVLTRLRVTKGDILYGRVEKIENHYTKC